MSGSSFATLARLDALLVARSHHPLTPFWREHVAAFYGHPSARLLAARVGRGGVKSGTATKIALNEVLCGAFAVPPGERHYFAFVSINRDEAAQRLRLIESFLDALAVPYTRSGDTIDLVAMPRGFRVFTATVGAVSGFRCIGWALDEAAKASNADHSANPSREIVASLRAMTVTHPNARGLLISSPLSTVDYHYETIEQGTTSAQYVCAGPTWTANPSISEAQTRTLEPDDRIWRREYAAQPSAAVSAAFDPAAVEAAFAPRDFSRLAAGDPILVIDPSSGRNDAFTSAIVRWAFDDHGEKYIMRHDNRPMRRADGTPIVRDGWKPRAPVLRFSDVAAVEGAFWSPDAAARIVDGLALTAAKYGARSVHADQREALSLASMFSAKGLRYAVHDWTAQSKPRAVEIVRRWLADRCIALPQNEKMQRELLEFEERYNASGALTFGARGSGHDDHVALLLTAALAEEAGDLHGSPLRPHVMDRWAQQDGMRRVLRAMFAGVVDEDEAEARAIIEYVRSKHEGDESW